MAGEPRLRVLLGDLGVWPDRWRRGVAGVDLLEDGALARVGRFGAVLLAGVGFLRTVVLAGVDLLGGPCPSESASCSAAIALSPVSSESVGSEPVGVVGSSASELLLPESRSERERKGFGTTAVGYVPARATRNPQLCSGAKGVNSDRDLAFSDRELSRRGEKRCPIT